jgi:uncharacterized protein
MSTTATRTDIVSAAYTRSTRVKRSSATSTVLKSSINVPREGLLMIISPAKTFNLSPVDRAFESDYLVYTQPDCCIVKTIAIARSMKRMSKAELSKVLKLSPSLTATTKEYWSSFQIEVMNNLTTQQPTHCKPCIYMYSGAAYQGISIADCDVHTVLYMQENLRILDALYGVLRPLDQIQPYRIEMDSKQITLPDTETPIAKLSAYWSDAITKRLIQDLQLPSHKSIDETETVPRLLPIVLNLASDEYSAAIDVEQLTKYCRYMKVIFHENQKVVAVHAKRARGMMVRYIAEMNATTLSEIQQFNVEGYQYVPDQSNDNTLVFNRPIKKTQHSALNQISTSNSNSSGTTSKRSKHTK